MAEKSSASGLCRDCAARRESAPDAPCPVCGGRRIIHHAELFSLSVAHLDCDAFYASIEKRDNPAIADQPVIVGGGTRGVVTTACYIARTYGVRSAMPMFKALKACPDAIVIRPNFAKYAAAARDVRKMMESLTPLVEPVSIDEAFLDLSGTLRIHQRTPAESLARLQLDIANALGITVSIGLSVNKFLAKTASDFDKPSGFSVIGEAEAKTVLARLPATAIWGVGPALAKRLAADGIATIADIQKLDPSTLASRYGDMGLRLARLAVGQDSRRVSAEGETKSVSAETTFNMDIEDVGALEKELWPLCEKVASRMKAKELVGRVATLKLKTDGFQTLTRRKTLDAPSNLARSLYNAAISMLAETAGGRRYRLIGAGYSDLSEEVDATALSLFADPNERSRKEEQAIDAIRARYGEKAIALGRTFAAKKAQGRSAEIKEPDDVEDREATR
jgi:DNA polymerase-4